MSGELNPTETFLCKLAIELGMSLTEVWNLPATEIHRWQRYFSEHLFSEDRQEYQLAMLALILHNVYFDNKAELKDFIPHIEHKQTKEEVITRLEMLRAVIGSEVEK
jgi:hypothetical protein